MTKYIKEYHEYLESLPEDKRFIIELLSDNESLLSDGYGYYSVAKETLNDIADKILKYFNDKFEDIKDNGG